ncbi:hypothetical protein [Variovorax humicola]|uniref:hypothetical protein n=1 Tax=Variovorax humicola TaxID=1769758 RepID=UPI003BF54CA0
MTMLGFALADREPMDERAATNRACHARVVPVVGTLDISIAGVPLDLPGSDPVCAFALAVGLFFAVPPFTG